MQIRPGRQQVTIAAGMEEQLPPQDVTSDAAIAQLLANQERARVTRGPVRGGGRSKGKGKGKRF